MEQGNHKPYHARWLSRAATETARYWTPPKIAVTMAAPVIVGISWAIFTPWPGREAIMQIAIISVIGFFGLWGVVFFVCLLSAPGKLDVDRLAEIDSQASTNTELRKQLEGLEEQAKKDPIEEHKKQRVRQWLEVLQAEQRNFVEALHTQGEMEIDPALAHKRPEFYGTIEAGRARGFIAERHEMRGPFGFRMIRISPDYAAAFYKVLHIEK